MIMTKCVECGTELAANARFCSTCGALVEKFKEISKDASVKRIVVKNENGKTILSVPVTWGAAGAVATLALAPWLAALGVIAGIATKCTLEVEKTPTVAAHV